MTGPELASALRTLGWPQRELARRIGCGETQIRRMVAGTRAIEPDLAQWLTQATECLEQSPIPRHKGQL